MLLKKYLRESNLGEQFLNSPANSRKKDPLGKFSIESGFLSIGSSVELPSKTPRTISARGIPKGVNDRDNTTVGTGTVTKTSLASFK